MNKYFQIIVLVCLLIFTNCTNNESDIETKEKILTEQGQYVKSSDLAQGEMRIKLSQDVADRINIVRDDLGRPLSSNIPSIDAAIESMNITKFERTFPVSEKFEKRSRAEGLHLWYDLSFDESTPITKAHIDLRSLKEIQFVEYRPKTVIFSGNITKYEEYIDDTALSRQSAMPFNDNLLAKQWHYHNDGSTGASVSGADINVFPAWSKYTTGNENVIVSVVDGGIDYSHEDLSENMWHNPEQTGELIYGYNFISNGYRVTPDEHGTHVAGTISAINNNGKGVCGIAGGDAERSIKGVKLMSCQIFEGDKSGSGASAIKWGADHGAVISQNSWGYKESVTYTPESDKRAIDYFNKYAGYDENMVQVGPMAGGIVIFASGNENANIGYPAEYEGVFAVASISADYKRAYYSNYGSWVDITAPGGDVRKGPQILSTLPGNKYGWMQGTSMACPHVSGVAALVVSKLGGKGFTNTALKKCLIESVKDISSYNPGYYLGVGLVNAYASIGGNSKIPPEKITEISASATSNNINFSLILPKDKDDGSPFGVNIYYSDKPISSLADANISSFEVGDLKAGDSLKGSLRKLKFNTLYYIAASAYDMSGNNSSISKTLEITTEGNHAPVITPLNGLTAAIKAYQSAILNFEISDSDSHEYSVKIEGDTSACLLTKENENHNYRLTINGKDAPAGNYKVDLIATDIYGLSSEVHISYTILENHPPVIIKEFDNILFNSIGEKITLNVSEYFNDEDEEPLTYSIKSDNNICHVTVNNELLYFVAISMGNSQITITATDVLGKSCETSLLVVIRDGSQEIDVYPNPVSENLYIRTSIKEDINISIYSISGSKLFDSTLEVSPFYPAKIDMKSFSAGSYTLVAKIGDKVIKRNIIKL